VQIVPAVVVGTFNGVPHGPRDRLGRLVVEQDAACVPKQAPGPAGDEDGTKNPRQRVHPPSAEEQAGQQSGDGQHRGEGVGQDMQVD
jgi:hypothetical protein